MTLPIMSESLREAEEEERAVDLIEKALSELAHSECPYCQAYIGLDRYLDRSDIRHWLENNVEGG